MTARALRNIPGGIHRSAEGIAAGVRPNMTLQAKGWLALNQQVVLRSAMGVVACHAVLCHRRMLEGERASLFGMALVARLSDRFFPEHSVWAAMGIVAATALHLALRHRMVRRHLGLNLLPFVAVVAHVWLGSPVINRFLAFEALFELDLLRLQFLQFLGLSRFLRTAYRKGVRGKLLILDSARQSFDLEPAAFDVAQLGLLAHAVRVMALDAAHLGARMLACGPQCDLFLRMAFQTDLGHILGLEQLRADDLRLVAATSYMCTSRPVAGFAASS